MDDHCAHRTYRSEERFLGMTMTDVLFQIVEKISEKSDKGNFIT